MIFEDRTYNKKFTVSTEWHNPNAFSVLVKELKRECHLFRKDRWVHVSYNNYASWDTMWLLVWKKYMLVDERTIWEVDTKI